MKKIKKRILLAFGTRPEAIKMAPLCHEFLRHADLFETAILVTAQHREMLDSVLEIFDIHPDYDLNVMAPGQTLSEVTSKVMIETEKILKEFSPDLVLVHGDTTSAMATALAAFYQQIKVAHIEAGLRTNDRFSPFPEEMNRYLVDYLSTYMFAPTSFSQENLLKEGKSLSATLVTGNTVIDALFYMLKKPFDLSKTNLPKKFIDNAMNGGKKNILITCHRRESFGEKVDSILNSIKDLATTFSQYEFLFPVHPNPNITNKVKMVLSDINNVHLVAPLDYQTFINVMKGSYLIISDSGGIQEEGPALGKPVVILRETSERPEAVLAGTAILAGTDRKNIVRIVTNLLTDEMKYSKMANIKNPFGDGTACQKIVEFLREKI